MVVCALLTQLNKEDCTMSDIIKPIVLDETMKEMNNILGSILRQGVAESTTWGEISNIVKKGIANKVFSVGDQLEVEWTDTATGTTYTVPMDVLAFREVTVEGGRRVPGMVLQWHYCTPFGVQLDANEALYFARDGLSAGTYNFTFGNSWGKAVSGKTYQFTLENEVPAGGHICLSQGYCDIDTSVWRISTYTNGSTTSAIETVTLSEGTGGTSLGTTNTSIKSTSDSLINNMHRCGYGYNRWSQSGLRQFLNSNKEKGSWWTSQNDFDRIPSECATKDGFMKGFDEEFLNVLGKVEIKTATNTVSDDGSFDTTYDTFYLPSLEECYINPQLSGEGYYYDYWKEKSQRSTPCAQYQTYEQMRTFAIENKTSPQTVRLRSANRGYAYGTWHINSSGYINGGGLATSSYRFAPVCVIV